MSPETRLQTAAIVLQMAAQLKAQSRAPGRARASAEEEQPLLENRFVRVRRSDAGLVIVVRSSLATETLEEIDETWGRVSRALAPLDRARHTLLMDMRLAPGRNDDVFERRVALYRAATVRGFPRVAVLVRSAPGQLQVRRHVREDALDRVRIFASESDALDWLKAATLS